MFARARELVTNRLSLRSSASAWKQNSLFPSLPLFRAYVSLSLFSYRFLIRLCLKRGAASATLAAGDGGSSGGADLVVLLVEALIEHLVLVSPGLGERHLRSSLVRLDLLQALPPLGNASGNREIWAKKGPRMNDFLGGVLRRNTRKSQSTQTSKLSTGNARSRHNLSPAAKISECRSRRKDTGSCNLVTAHFRTACRSFRSRKGRSS